MKLNTVGPFTLDNFPQWSELIQILDSIDHEMEAHIMEINDPNKDDPVFILSVPEKHHPQVVEKTAAHGISFYKIAVENPSTFSGFRPEVAARWKQVMAQMQSLGVGDAEMREQCDHILDIIQKKTKM